MTTLVKDIRELIQDSTKLSRGWEARVVIQEDNLTYVAWSETSREALVVDPVREDWDTLLRLCQRELLGYRFVAVIDTHTHADHVSCAARLSFELGVPLIQHELSPSRRVHLRISRDTALPTMAGPLRMLVTPGHTPDSLTPIWGPFLFAGDTLMYGDTGRDDLPGGDPFAHWESLQKLKAQVSPETLILPGHDDAGGRVSSWKHQQEINPSLAQDRATFVADAGAYTGPAPKHLKESLFENFK